MNLILGVRTYFCSYAGDGVLPRPIAHPDRREEGREDSFDRFERIVSPFKDAHVKSRRSFSDSDQLPWQKMTLFERSVIVVRCGSEQIRNEVGGGPDQKGKIGYE